MPELPELINLSTMRSETEHDGGEDRMDSPSRMGLHRMRLGEYLETLPIRVVATLTFPKPVGEVEAETSLRAWILKVQDVHQATVAWVAAAERAPGIPLHYHVLLIAGKPLDPIAVQQAWRAIVGPQYETSAMAMKYVLGLGGSMYTIKWDDRDGCQVRFSENIDLFHPYLNTRKGGTSADRRQRRRVMAQRTSALQEVRDAISQSDSGQVFGRSSRTART